MARLITFPGRVHKRGNSNRLRGRHILNVPTKFEKEVERLGLEPQAYVKSAELRAWCQRHRDQCYIPERLLKAWGIAVDTWEDTTARAA